MPGLLAQPGLPETREFGNPAETRAAIFQNVLNAASGVQAFSTDRHTKLLPDVPDEGHEEPRANLWEKNGSRSAQCHI